MGKKLSRLNCIKAEAGLKQQGVSKKRSNGRKTAMIGKERNINFAVESAVVEVNAGNHTRNMHDDEQAIIMPTTDLQKLEIFEENEENSIANKHNKMGDQRRKQTHLVPVGNKKIGNSTELLACPEMSTITAISDRRGTTSGCAQTSKLPLPTFVTTGENFMPMSQLSNERVSAAETSNSTLLVPPNSVNSQFISGITPMDSLQEISADGASDSVFARDFSCVPEPFLDAAYFANFGTGHVLLNNNSLVASAECIATKAREQFAKGGNSIEMSSGPGLDSDFGASAGIEMRIVSSDFSGVNNNVSRPGTAEREQPSVSDLRFKMPASEMKTRREITRVAQRTMSVPAETTDWNRRQLYGILVRQPRRFPSSIGCSENVFQTTMDWDPYDTYYGINQWREYFIPGIAYPARPLLCSEEHWL